MSIEGEITVTLHWDGQRVHHVGLASTRPLAAARVLLGRAPADAAALVPRLYALCGQAQGAACAAALRAAAGHDGEAQGAADAGIATVLLEMLQEALWRLLIDAPRSLSLPPQVEALAPVRAAVAQAAAALKARPGESQAIVAAAAGALGAIARDQVYGEPPAAWLERTDPAEFDTWRDTAATLPARALARMAATTPGLGRSDTSLMPGLDDEAWWSAVVPALQHDPQFAQAPTWGGRPVETGALARWQAQPLVAALIARDGHSAATRLAARLVEAAVLLAELGSPQGPARGWIRHWTLADGSGLAAVQSARGLLIHHAGLAQGRIAQYGIVAPTEWNFHPQGALSSGLVGTEAPDEAALVACAGLAVHALDPCVGFRIEVVRHA